MFDDAFRRRLQGAEPQFGGKADGWGKGGSSQPPLTGRYLEGAFVNQNDVCVCPRGVEPGPGQGPTAEEFEGSFSSHLVELVETGVLETSGYVGSEHGSGTSVIGNVLEGQQVECTSPVVRCSVVLPPPARYTQRATVRSSLGSGSVMEPLSSRHRSTESCPRSSSQYL